MNNLMVFLIFAIVNFALITVAFRFWGKQGILAYIVLSVIAANLQVNKGVSFDFGLFQLEATLGNVMFAGIFLATDLLNEKYGFAEARKAVVISIFANLSFILIMFISTIFKGLDYSSDFTNASDEFRKETGRAYIEILGKGMGK